MAVESSDTSAEQAAPKKRPARRPRRKKVVSKAKKESDGEAEAAAAAEIKESPGPPADGSEAEKPARRRRRRTRKPAADEEAADTNGEAVAGAEVPADAAAAAESPETKSEKKPSRRTRKRKKAVSDSAAAEKRADDEAENTETVAPPPEELVAGDVLVSAVAASTEPVEPEAGKKPARRRRRKTAAASDDEARPAAAPAEEPADLEPAAASAPAPVVADVEEFGFGLLSPAEPIVAPVAPLPPAPANEPVPDESPAVEAAPLADVPAPAEAEGVEPGTPEPTVVETPVPMPAEPEPAEPRKKRPSRRERRKKAAARRAEAAAPAEPSAPPPPEVRKERPRPAARSDREGAPRGKGLEMIINASSGDECRIAVIESGRLEELYIERHSAESHVGNVYKGWVTNVEPSIQAVFVDFGQPKNGFLHISDVHPKYFPDGEGVFEDVGRKIPRRDRPPIQKCFRRGQDVLVQVTKEGVGTKGPTLTSYLSIPGRFLVMMPGMSRLGVSRKIEDEAERRSMRDVLNQLPLPEGIGFILRTAGLGRTKRELQRDLNYLHRLWKIISERVRKTRAPAEVYQESDLVIRTIRDVLTNDFSRIVVDDESTAEKAREFLKIALPRTQDLVEVNRSPEPLFHRFGIEEEIERINSRHVPLRSGGSLVVESTEAMVAIDVNSGKFREIDDAETSAYQINLEAADEIARQLRLRDLGGLIVCDFIDMRLERHKREVERRLRNALKKHKERARILRMSQFGLIEMTRQRQRSSIRQSIFTECPHCKGVGMIKSTESMGLEVMRILQLAAHQKGVRRITVTVAPNVAATVQNQKRAQLADLETRTHTVITIRSDPVYAPGQVVCECEDERGRPLRAPE